MKLLLFLTIITCFGLTQKMYQVNTSFYHVMEFGKYKTGYDDTVIFNSRHTYQQYGYNGPAPLFVQIWHPVSRVLGTKPLTYHEFRKRNFHDSTLSKVYHHLCKKMDSSFISYYLSETIDSFAPLQIGDLTPWDVLKKIKAKTTTSYKAKLPIKNNRPIIIYHHGAQGLSDENYILCEYFASKGYLVLSGNFHLPFESWPYGSIPYEHWENLPYDQSNLHSIIRYAKSISPGQPIYYIGHSWGAQEGWISFHEKGLVDAFVSMETTIEFKTDTVEIKNKWQKVYETINNRQNTFQLPILAFACTKENKPFEFFKGKGNPLLCVSSKEEIDHDGYTSAIFLRYFAIQNELQPDLKELQNQLNNYLRHLDLIAHFLKSCAEKKKFESKKFLKHFFIN